MSFVMFVTIRFDEPLEEVLRVIERVNDYDDKVAAVKYYKWKSAYYDVLARGDYY